jgi:hypothetical protein
MVIRCHIIQDVNQCRFTKRKLALYLKIYPPSSPIGMLPILFNLLMIAVEETVITVRNYGIIPTQSVEISIYVIPGNSIVVQGKNYVTPF